MSQDFYKGMVPTEIEDLITVDSLKMMDLQDQMSKLNIQFEICCLAAQTLDLTKKDIQEMKTFSNPPQAINEIMTIVLVIFGFKKKDQSIWDKQKKFMLDLHFFDKLKNYPYSNLKKETLIQVKKMMDNSTIKGGFNYESFMKKSVPSAALCNWVINWYAAGSAVNGVAQIQKDMEFINEAMAFKYSMIESIEQEKLMNYIPPETCEPDLGEFQQLAKHFQ